MNQLYNSVTGTMYKSNGCHVRAPNQHMAYGIPRHGGVQYVFTIFLPIPWYRNSTSTIPLEFQTVELYQ